LTFTWSCPIQADS